MIGWIIMEGPREGTTDKLEPDVMVNLQLNLLGETKFDNRSCWARCGGYAECCKQ